MDHEKYLQLINTNHYPSDDDEIVADDRAQAKLVDVVIMMVESGLKSAQRKSLPQSVQTDCHASTGGLLVKNSRTNILHIRGFHKQVSLSY
jgi:hypothetical protein